MYAAHAEGVTLMNRHLLLLLLLELYVHPCLV
jgi:hypothetical protein